MMNVSRKLAGITVAVALTAGVTTMTVSPADAKAVRVVKAHKDVKHPKRVKMQELRSRRLVVTFRDGSRYRFTPCRYEDSRNCYWLAHKRGNKRGKSFVNLRGRIIYLSPVI